MRKTKSMKFGVAIDDHLINPCFLTFCTAQHYLLEGCIDADLKRLFSSPSSNHVKCESAHPTESHLASLVNTTTTYHLQLWEIHLRYTFLIIFVEESNPSIAQHREIITA